MDLTRCESESWDSSLFFHISLWTLDFCHICLEIEQISTVFLVRISIFLQLYFLGSCRAISANHLPHLKHGTWWLTVMYGIKAYGIIDKQTSIWVLVNNVGSAPWGNQLHKWVGHLFLIWGRDAVLSLHRLLSYVHTKEGWIGTDLMSVHVRLYNYHLHKLISLPLTAKPIDLLAKYINADEDDFDVEMHEPYTYLNVSDLRIPQPWPLRPMILSTLGSDSSWPWGSSRGH